MKPYSELKARQRADRDDYAVGLALRIHRALSWLNRAEMADDIDARFIFLWIAFNAAYAQELRDIDGFSESKAFVAFLDKLLALDRPESPAAQSRLESLVWDRFSGSIRVLLKNQFIFPQFWDHHQGKITASQWQDAFAKSNAAAMSAMTRRDTKTALSIVLNRIYTLRNQLMHGGATWNGAVNRDQIRDCVDFMSELVPLAIEIMMDNPNTLWGDAAWPVL